ncbi:MAG: hypothetical protein PUG67_08735 [Peptoniphilaceae bacterium]|nr:hypothetical protein [Peptoniphilaceae bacterium]MDY6018694.1 hypothetical protein [Anaerococcus sp.]
MTESFEKIRALNVIWDFANDYKLAPNHYYPMDENYKNIILGYIYRTFDLALVDNYFKLLKKSNPFYKEFKNMTKLVMENIAYINLSKTNLVISDFRKKYAREIDKFYSYKKDTTNVYEQIEKAYYEKILNKPITESFLVRELFRELFAIETKDTKDLLKQLDQVFKKYFLFEEFNDDNSLFKDIIKDKKGKESEKKDTDSPSEYTEKSLEELFNAQSAEFTGNIYFEEKQKDMNKNKLFFADDNKDYTQSNDYIEDFYGKSIISLQKQKSLEEKLAKGIHKSKKLYFTKGEYSNSPNAMFNKKTRRKQSEKNKTYIENNLAINNRAINDLKRTIKNSIANYEDEDINQKNTGIINSTRVWRAPILNDYNVFQKIELDKKAKFKVDLLIDGSASQIERQSVVANQAFIIAQTMDDVDIPIRVMSFSTLRDHTVFNIYRDYMEKGKNKNIYNFFASGSNRDGLAFKTLHHILDKENQREEGTRRILIVLSDGKPHDEKQNINTKSINQKDQYIDKTAVDDAAKEIRNIKKDGIAVLGVFTGADEDVENAKLIYNNDFCRITNLENFSKIVSIFMKNQILNN